MGVANSAGRRAQTAKWSDFENTPLELLTLADIYRIKRADKTPRLFGQVKRID